MNSFKLPEVDHCCCCISLRIGTIIFGVLSCVGGLLVLILSAVFLKVAGDLLEEQEVEDGAKAVAFSFFYMAIAIGLVMTLVSIFLTYGAVYKKTSILSIWIVLLGIGIVADFIALMLLFTPLQESKPTNEKLQNVGGYITNAVFSAYMIVVIQSYKHEIHRENQNTVP